MKAELEWIAGIADMYVEDPQAPQHLPSTSLALY